MVIIMVYHYAVTIFNQYTCIRLTIIMIIESERLIIILSNTPVISQPVFDHQSETPHAVKDHGCTAHACSRASGQR